MPDFTFRDVEALACKIGKPGTFVVVRPLGRRGRIRVVGRRGATAIKMKVHPPRASEAARQAFIDGLRDAGADVVDQGDHARLLRSERRALRQPRDPSRKIKALRPNRSTNASDRELIIKAAKGAFAVGHLADRPREGRHPRARTLLDERGTAGDEPTAPGR
jgi:hypothetical protein